MTFVSYPRIFFRDRLEVWNPGKLPDGFTIQKLHEVHRSEPTNPVIAHPLFMAGYIEHLGTGTTDIIADCEEAGLPTPEFIQADDFRTIIYRKVSDPEEKVSDLTPKVSDPEEKVSNFGKKVTELAEKVSKQDEKSNQAAPKRNQVRQRRYSGYLFEWSACHLARCA